MSHVNAYRDTAIATQGGGQLVVMLYDGAIKFLRLAVVELEKGNFVGKGQYISKAQAIINELNTVLDMEGGGEISRNLRSLYMFMLRHLTRANIDRDSRALLDVITQLETLNDGWRTIVN